MTIFTFQMKMSHILLYRPKNKMCVKTHNKFCVPTQNNLLKYYKKGNK